MERPADVLKGLRLPVNLGFADPTPVIGHYCRDRGDLIEDGVPILDGGNGSRLKHNYRLSGLPSAQVRRSNTHCVPRHLNYRNARSWVGGCLRGQTLEKKQTCHEGPWTENSSHKS